MYLSADDPFLAGLSGELVRRGVEAVLPLHAKGEDMRQLADHLQKLRELTTHSTQPVPSLGRPKLTYCSRFHLEKGREDLLRLLFAEAEEVTLTEVSGRGATARKLIVETEQGRRYFVKIGRWDSVMAEYANYLDLIQGKHENYAGRAIGRPELRGYEGALRFSLAGTGQAPPKRCELFYRMLGGRRRRICSEIYRR